MNLSISYVGKVNFYFYILLRVEIYNECKYRFIRKFNYCLTFIEIFRKGFIERMRVELVFEVWIGYR